MPTQVVVVKRSRKRPFEVVWALPAWLRSLLRSFRTSMARRMSLGGRAASPSWARSDVLHLGRPAVDPAMWPVLKLESRRGEDPSDRCSRCGECVSACPSRCLSLVPATLSEVGDIEPGAGSVARDRLLLSMWGCIGCGKCVEICPEDALEMKPGTLYVARSRIIARLRKEIESVDGEWDMANE